MSDYQGAGQPAPAFRIQASSVVVVDVADGLVIIRAVHQDGVEGAGLVIFPSEVDGVISALQRAKEGMQS